MFVSPMRRSATLRPSIQHHDAVADDEQVLQAVRDQDDADALGAHGPDQLENRVDFGDRERGGRLVHDEDERIEGHRAADGDALPLSARRGSRP